MRQHLIRPFVTLLVAVLFVAPSLPAGAGVDINIGGTTNLAPLLLKLAADYEHSHPGVTISVGGTNTGAGIASLKKHDIDIAMSDVAVDKYGFSDTVLGTVGFAFVANPDCGIKNLTREQLMTIFSGQVTNWKAVGGNDRPIVLIGRDIGTGARFVFEDKVARTVVPVRVVADESDVLKAVARTSGSLGYLASGFLSGRGDLVITYEGVAPTPATIRASGYSFSTLEHLYTNRNASPDVAAFVQYVKSSTDQLIANGIY